MSGENLDITSDDAAASMKSPADIAATRRFVGIRFACCDLYVRVYINREGTAYQGNCPRCAKRVELQIAPGGSDARFFTAY